ncbi:hypothetical protein SK128_000850, partial [Halocaridina rubra]
MSKRRLKEEEIQLALLEDDDDYEPSDTDSDGTNDSSSDESQDDTVTEEEDLEAPTSPENDSYRQGRENLPQRRVRSLGRPSKSSKELKNVDHMPVHEESRRRCIRCSSRKKEKRTRAILGYGALRDFRFVQAPDNSA